MTRFVLEGTWSGYRAEQRKVVHREILNVTRAKKHILRCVRYTDGTTLDLTLREAKPRERIVQINGYGKLLREAEATGRSYVTVGKEV